MDKLSEKKCVPCEGGASPLSSEHANLKLQEIQGWQVSSDTKAIFIEYIMKDFMAALELMGAIAQVAENENHHPDLHLTGYRKLRIVLSTHAIGGLSENDFIVASKIDLLSKQLKA